jgi:hypothetical protein
MKWMRWLRIARLDQRGLSTTELLVATAIVGSMVLVGVPMLDDARRSAALVRSTIQVQGLLVRCRAVAVMRGATCAVVFDRETGGRWRCYVAEDGDGDGVRRADIHSGRDPVVGTDVVLGTGGAGPGILRDERVPDPSGRGILGGDLSDPIRAGRGNMISFSSRGTASPSSVYFTDFSSRMVVLRIYGGTGRINRLSWRCGWSDWKQG